MLFSGGEYGSGGDGGGVDGGDGDGDGGGDGGDGGGDGGIIWYVIYRYSVSTSTRCSWTRKKKLAPTTSSRSNKAHFRYYGQTTS